MTPNPQILFRGRRLAEYIPEKDILFMVDPEEDLECRCIDGDAKLIADWLLQVHNKELPKTLELN
jgi:hypothetical protein